MKNYIQLAIYYMVLFMLFFGFQIHGINTRYLATAILISECFFVSQYRDRCLKFIKTLPARYLKSIVIYNIITFLWTFVLSANDINMFVGTFRLVIIAFDLIMLWAILPEKYRKYHLQLIVGIFVLQSFIIFAAFISPSVLDIVRNFQFEGIMEVTDRYLNHGTFRGLALSGDQFYGLTASFGLISIIVMKLYVDSSKFIWIGIFFILFAANMFVGRTGFVGFAAALGYLFINNESERLKLIVKVGFYTIIIIVILYQLLPSSTKEILNESVFAYAFQLFYNYSDNDSFSTSSSDRVLEMWKIEISFLTLLIGDGKFLNANGSYYGHVDVGYLRQILYGGFIYLVFSIILVFKFITNYSNKVSVQNYKFELILFLYLLATHAKGLSFMYCPEMMMIVLFYYYHKNYECLKCIR